MTSGAAVDGDTVVERRPVETTSDQEGRERLLRRGEETTSTSQKSRTSKEGDELGFKRSSSQRSQLPTRVRQMTSQMSASGAPPAASTLPRPARERERLSQRRAVTSSAFLLRDSGRVKPLCRPASAADIDREEKKERMDVSSPPTSAVSTPTLSTASTSAAASRPDSATRSSSRAESLPRKASRVSIMTEEEKRKRELGWNSPQNRSKSLPRLHRSVQTTRKSSAPVVERLTRPPPLRKARSFATTQPAIEEAPEATKASRRASARFASPSGKLNTPVAKTQFSARKTSPPAASSESVSAADKTKTAQGCATSKTSVSGRKTSANRMSSSDVRVTSPASRVTSPDSRITSPDSRVTSPDSRVTSPISRNASPSTRSLPASCRRQSRCSPIPEPDASAGSCRRSSQPKFSDPSQFRPPSSLARLSVTAKTPPTSFSRAAIPKESGTSTDERQKHRKQSADGQNTSVERKDSETEHPNSHNDSGVIVGLEVKKEDETIAQETTPRRVVVNETTVKRVEFTSDEVTPEKVDSKVSEKRSVSELESVSSTITQGKELSLTEDAPPPSSNLPSPDGHDLSHATSASEETGYVSSASHSPPSRSASGSRVSGIPSSEMVLRFDGESSSTLDRLAEVGGVGDSVKEKQSTANSTEETFPSKMGQSPSAEGKDTRKSKEANLNGVVEENDQDSYSLSDIDRRGRKPQRSFHGPPRAGVSSATLDRFRRSSLTPERFGGSLDRRRSTSSPSEDAAELSYLRDTLLLPGAGAREESLDRYLAGVARLLRLSRRSAGFQQLKPHYQALQRATETGAPAAELRQIAGGHVKALLEQLEQQQQQQHKLKGVGGDRSRASGRWSGDVGLRFRGRSVEDLKRMFAGQTQSPTRSEPRSQSLSQSRRESTTSSLTQSQVGRLRQQLQQLHRGDSPGRDVKSPSSARSGFSVDVTDLNGLSNVLPVRPPPPEPPVRSHTSYSLASRSTTLPSVSSTASSQLPASSEDRHRLVERSERLRRLREERVGRPLASGVRPVSSPASAMTSPHAAAPPGASLSPHLPNPVQKPPRVRDIPEDGFRSLPSGSRLRRQRAMTSVQYVPQRTVSEQLDVAAEGGGRDGHGAPDGDVKDRPPGAVVRPISAESRREARETSHRASAPPSLAWEVSSEAARRRPLPTPRSAEDTDSDVQKLACKHLPEPEPQRRRRPSVRKLLLSGFSSLRRKWRSRSRSRKRRVDTGVVVKLSENGGGDGENVQPPAVETKVMKVDAATSTAVDTNVKRIVSSPHRVRTVGHISTAASTSSGRPGRSGPSKSRRPPPEISLIGQMFTSSPELGDAESHSRAWLHTSTLRDEFRPVSNFSARTEGSAAGSSMMASTPVPPSESSDFSAVWRGPAEMDWSIHRPVGRYVPGAGGSSGGGGGGYRSLPRPRTRRHPPPPATGSLPRPLPRKTPCPCCVQPGAGERRSRRDPAGDGASASGRQDVAGPRYQEAAVNIHYRSPVRWEAKEPFSEEELRRRQEDNMRRVYEESRRRREERLAEDRESRRHGDNFTPSQKSPIPLDRYERLFDDVTDDRRPTLTAAVLHEFRAQNNRELSLSRGDTVRIRRKIDSNWYEGQKGSRIGIFPVTYVQVTDPRERSAERRSTRPQVRARHRFTAQSSMELSLNKGDVVTILRRVDDNWFEGRRGDTTGIFPASYVEPLNADNADGGSRQKPVGAPAAHGLVMDGLSLRSSSERDPPRAPSAGRDQLRVEVQQNTMPYRVLFPYRHQNEDELDLEEGDTIHVLEQCPDGWYVGTNVRTGMFGTFPGNYTRRM